MTDKAEVGIFWTWEGKLFHLESVPMSAAVRTQVSYDYAVGHYAAWQMMAKRGILNQLPPHMRDEYDCIPRGRVIYLIDKESFVIYHGDEFNKDIHHELIERLHLSDETVVDEVDEHYNPLPKDFLF